MSELTDSHARLQTSVEVSFEAARTIRDSYRELSEQADEFDRKGQANKLNWWKENLEKFNTSDASDLKLLLNCQDTFGFMDTGGFILKVNKLIREWVRSYSPMLTWSNGIAHDFNDTRSNIRMDLIFSLANTLEDKVELVDALIALNQDFRQAHSDTMRSDDAMILKVNVSSERTLKMVINLDNTASLVAGGFVIIESKTIVEIINELSRFIGSEDRVFS